jgi:broad specificity phosphatase PhoE
MSTLYLVRHAQASFLEADYDQLSERGIEQARCLGRYFSDGVHRFDAVWSGPRRRHRHTAEAVLAALGDAAPRLAELGDLDEYPADEVLAAALPGLAGDPSVAALVRDTSSSDRRVRGRAVDRLLQQALRRWVVADAATDGAPETWRAFSERVRRAFDEMVARAGRGARVVAFSSAGAIGAMVGQVLRADDETALELGWRLDNASVTEIEFSEGRATLSRFNVVGHITEPALRTRR